MRDYYNTLTDATMQVFAEMGFAHYIKDVSKIRRTLIALKRKYLDAYQPEDAEAILTDAWLHVFKTNGHRNFAEYNGLHPKSGGKMDLVLYASFLLRNMIINQSQKATRKFLQETQLSGYENEAEEDTLQRNRGRATSRPAHRIDEDEVEALESYIADIQKLVARVKDGYIKPRHPDKEIKKLQDKIDALREQVKEAQGLGAFTPHLEWDDVYCDYSYEEDQAYHNLLTRIAKSLPCRHRLCFYALESGLSKSELAVFFAKPTSYVEKLIDEISERMEHLSYLLNSTGDTCFCDLLKAYAKEGKKMKGVLKPDRREVCRQLKRIIKSIEDEDTRDELMDEFFYGDIQDIEDLIK